MRHGGHGNLVVQDVQQQHPIGHRAKNNLNAASLCAGQKMVEEDEFRDVTHFRAAVLRMHDSNQAVLMWNKARDMKIMIRIDPDEDPDAIVFEYGFVFDDEDDEITRVFDLEADGYVDDGLFVVEAYSFKRQDLLDHPHVLEPARQRLNELFQVTVCPCGLYLIKDKGPICLYCQMTSVSGQDREHMCAICHETSMERHMVRQACCGQPFHRACLAKWKTKSATCPMCREPTTRVSLSPVSTTLSSQS